MDKLYTQPTMSNYAEWIHVAQMYEEKGDWLN